MIDSTKRILRNHLASREYNCLYKCLHLQMFIFRNPAFQKCWTNLLLDIDLPW